MNTTACKRILLDKNWMFCAGEARRWETVPHMLCYDMTKAGYQLGVMDIFLNQNKWQEVPLPHDWNTAEPSDLEGGICNNGYKKRGVGWYFLRFNAPDFTDDQSVLLEFEGIMGDSLVYINGARAMRNHSGYNGFYEDVTAYLVPNAENTLAVRVDTSTWEGWWYEGAGIYRPVILHVRPAVHFKHLSPFACPVLKDGEWFVDLSAIAENSSESLLSCCAEARLMDNDGNIIAIGDMGRASVSALGETELKGCLKAENIRLWDIDEPNLYWVEFLLKDENGNIMESQRVRCGFRDIQWTADRGMLLNGRPVPVNGICCHQDHVGVGIAVSKSIVRYRIQRLKEMGCNAYRCAHHMPWEYLLEACDELGMLVMDENRHFNTMDETLRQVDDMVLRGRNHPSVFMYCLFNEEYWQDERRGYLIARSLARRVRALDTSRPTTAAMNGGVLTEKNASDVTDVAGMNYFIKDFGNFAKRCPGKPLVGTENGPIFCTRGEPDHDPERRVFGGYGDRTSPSGELMDETMDAAENAPHVAGVFMWGGFDYRGEPFPYTWPSVFSHWGFTDMCGFRKDSSYLLESYYSTSPVLYVTPHWNLPEGKIVRVCAFSNAERVELFLNGRSLGEKAVDHRRVEWEVPFEAGELKAIGHMADGSEITFVRKTSGPAASIKTEIVQDPSDNVVMINVALKDKDGLDVFTDDREINIHVENGVIVGIGNGDPNAALLPDIGDTLPTFHGLCQIIIHKDGAAKVCLSSEGLPECTLEIK